VLGNATKCGRANDTIESDAFPTKRIIGPTIEDRKIIARKSMYVHTHIHTEEEMFALIFSIPGAFPASVPSSIFQLLTQ